MAIDAGRDAAARHASGTPVTPGMPINASASTRSGYRAAKTAETAAPIELPIRLTGTFTSSRSSTSATTSAYPSSSGAPQARRVAPWPGQVDRDDAVLDRERRDDPAPGEQVVREPVQQHERVRTGAGDDHVHVVEQRLRQGRRHAAQPAGGHDPSCTRISHPSNTVSGARPRAGPANARGPGSPSTRTAAARRCCR